MARRRRRPPPPPPPRQHLTLEEIGHLIGVRHNVIQLLSLTAKCQPAYHLDLKRAANINRTGKRLVAALEAFLRAQGIEEST